MFKAYWEQQSSLTRQRLVVLGVVVAILISWLFIWQPLSEQQQMLVKRAKKQQDTLEWMRTVSPRLQVLSAQSSSQLQREGLQPLVNRIARQHNIKLDRVRVLGDERVQLQCSQCAFSQITRFLAQLETSAVYVDSVVLRETRSSGIVSFNVVVSAKR